MPLFIEETIFRKTYFLEFIFTGQCLKNAKMFILVMGRDCQHSKITRKLSEILLVLVPVMVNGQVDFFQT